MDYFVVFYNKKGLSKADKVNAQSKARDDVKHTLLSLGAKEIAIHRTDYPIPFCKDKKGSPKNFPIVSGLVQYTEETIKLSVITKGDRVFFQDFVGPHCMYSMYLCNKKGAEIHVIVHDVPSVRFREYAIAKDVACLNKSDVVYIHTEAFRDLLIRNGLTVSTKVIHLFDYYTEDKMREIEDIRKDKNVVVFAGNLAKSEFLQAWLNQKLETISVRLYGLLGDLKPEGCFEYAGTFTPSKTGVVKGGWGLVWDGDSTKTCSGVLGDYLRYNSSHKMSLYLACGMPLIVWEKSSLASWIKEHKLGICISSLKDMEYAINSIPEEVYLLMLKNVQQISYKLRDGKFLRKAIGIE